METEEGTLAATDNRLRTLQIDAMHKEILTTIVFAALFSGSLFAQNRSGITTNDGLISIKELPKKTISDDIVLLKVPHIRQKPGNCVPTSCAMILRYIGESVSPVGLKKLAENHKPKEKRNTEFTYWKDMLYALSQKGKDWKIERFEMNDEGFESGFEQIKASLRNDLPVVVEIHQGAGHSLVVMGFDENKEQVYLRDPFIEPKKARAFTYAEFKAVWHNHKYSKSRSVMIPSLVK